MSNFVINPDKAPVNNLVDYVKQGIGLLPCFGMIPFANTESIIGLEEPDLFCPTNGRVPVEQWINAAKLINAKYIVFITQEQGGFCLWPSVVNSPNSAYSIAASTRFNTNSGGQDFLMDAVVAARAAGLKVGFYYIICDGNASDVQYVNMPQATFLAFKQAQLTELFARYGDIDYLWVDGGHWFYNSWYPWNNPADMLKFMHSLQANLMVINNTHLMVIDGSDIIEYEGAAEHPPTGNTIPSEQVSSGLTAGWYWLEHQNTPKSASTLLSEMRTANTNGAAYLLGCAPDRTGAIPANQITQYKIAMSLAID